MHKIDVQHDLIFDVGLHKGEDSAYYLGKGFRVVAFEASERLIEAARTRFSALPDGRFRTVFGAISSSTNELVSFYSHPSSPLGTIKPDRAERNRVLGEDRESQESLVPVVRLTDTILETGMPVFMKIDIEGLEITCLRELLEFENRPISVSIESTRANWEALEEEFDLLGRLGYDIFAVRQQATVPNAEVETKAIDGQPLRYRFEPDSSGGFGSDIGPWLDRESTLKQYRRLFTKYRLCSLVDRGRRSHRVIAKLQGVTGVPMPGWYDTHAARRSEMKPPVFWDRA